MDICLKNPGFYEDLTARQNLLSIERTVLTEATLRRGYLISLRWVVLALMGAGLFGVLPFILLLVGGILALREKVAPPPASRPIDPPTTLPI